METALYFLPSNTPSLEINSHSRGQETNYKGHVGDFSFIKRGNKLSFLENISLTAIPVLLYHGQQEMLEQADL